MDDLKAQNYFAELIQMDVTKRCDWNKALEFAKATFGDLDILVNNAGWTYRRKATLEVSDTEYESLCSLYTDLSCLLMHDDRGI